jgi:hypothetical protein
MCAAGGGCSAGPRCRARIERRLQLPDRVSGGCFSDRSGTSETQSHRLHLASNRSYPPFDRLGDGRLRLQLAGRPHDRIPGFAFEPVGFPEFRLGSAADQDRQTAVVGVDAVRLADALRSPPDSGMWMMRGLMGQQA